MQCLLAAYEFDYTALRIKPSLTSCKELATVMDISQNNNRSSCNASYVLPHKIKHSALGLNANICIALRFASCYISHLSLMPRALFSV